MITGPMTNSSSSGPIQNARCLTSVKEVSTVQKKVPCWENGEAKILGFPFLPLNLDPFPLTTGCVTLYYIL